MNANAEPTQDRRDISETIQLPSYARIPDIEAALEAAGIPFRRWFEWNEGWMFEVEGKIVARCAAIGLLEWEMQRWVAKPHRNPDEGDA